MEEYDVIIAGAGPAGGNCARELSGLGHSVLLIEKSKVIGIPNFSTAGTPNETMKAFDLPNSVTDSPWSSILIGSKNRRAEFLFRKKMGYVLNYKLLKQFLAKQSKKHGAEILTGTNVTEAIIKNGFVRGVKFSENGSQKEAFGKVVVDASGGRALLSQKLGLVELKKNDIAVGVEYLMKKVDFERKERMEFYLGPNYVPYGYAWIFPAGTSCAKVGVGILRPTKIKIKLLEYLKKFAEENTQTREAVQVDAHSGSLFASGGIKNHVLDGFMAIGDAAVQINPLGGEGIRHALFSGKLAAQVIDSALEDGSFGKKNLEPYNEKWRGYVGNKWKISAWLQKVVYKATLNERLTDVFVKEVSKFDPQTIFEILFNYKFELAFKSVPKLFKMGMRI